MPRQARLDYPGAYHHVMGRGIDGLNIFKEDADKKDFLSRLRTLQQESNLKIYAWCLMSNHFHLLYQTGTKTLSAFMRALLTGYAINYNKRHRRRGYLFQNRYKSIVVESDEYFNPLVRYIHLNPVKAKIIPLEKINNYPWCGHRDIVKKSNVNIIDRDEVLGYFGDKERTAVKNYKEYLSAGLKVNDDHLLGGGVIRSLGGWREAIKIAVDEREMGDERILGNGGFVEEVLKVCEKEEARIFTDVDDLLEKISCVYGVDKEAILETKVKNVWEARAVFVFFAVKYLNVSVKGAGKFLKIKNAAASLAMRKGMEIGRKKGILEKLLMGNKLKD